MNLTRGESPDTMTIEVIGPGCSFCKRLYHLVREVASEQGIDADVVHVKNITTVLRYIPFTPVLKINGRIVHRGKCLPEKDKLRDLFCLNEERTIR